MLALFCGTASLPHILIRYYTVKDAAAARKSTIVGIGSIGFFYVLTLFLGLGAMTSHALDPTDSNMAAPLLAKSFGNLPFAVISAIAFTTVLGTVSGLIMAASGAVAHDLMTSFLKIKMNDHQKVLAGKIVAVVVGIIAIVLGVTFRIQCRVPGRMGFQRRRVGKPACPGHAPVLAQDDQSGNHGGHHRRPDFVADLAAAERPGYMLYRCTTSTARRSGEGSLQPAGHHHDSTWVHRAGGRFDDHAATEEPAAVRELVTA